MGAQLILGAQQILMVLGAQGAQEDQTEGGKPREPRRGKPRNSKRCWQHNRQLWTEAMCAKEQFFTKNFPFLILRTLREGLLDRLFPKCWHRQQKRGLTSAIIFLMDLSTMYWGPPNCDLSQKKVMISPQYCRHYYFTRGLLNMRHCKNWETDLQIGQECPAAQEF